MGMHCKVNDLAFIRKALRPENIGLVIECKEYLGYYLRGDDIEMNGERWGAIISDNYWRIENSYGEIETMYGKSTVAISPDTWLEPIPTKKLIIHETTEDGLHV